MTWKPEEIVSGQAATEDQLKAATEGMLRYDKKEDGTVDTSRVTLAENKKDDKVVGTVINNVADGKLEEGSKEAVNGGQLHEAWQGIGQNAQNINKLSNAISTVNGRVAKVGAGAAALAALHPMDFDPDDKLSFAAGFGNYGGSNATSLGAFYRPTEKMMVSVGGTYGNGENMVNMGLSFALDKANNVSNSRVAMAKEMVAMREHMVKQDQQLAEQNQQIAMQSQQIAQLVKLVNQLTGQNQAIPATIAPQNNVYFPDIPENHWAYEYVNRLAEAGIVEGYENGLFQGDRTMTRYEFATMLYKALAKGVVLDEKIMDEFRYELGRIRVDLVAGAANTDSSIERVRVNTDARHNEYGDKMENTKEA